MPKSPYDPANWYWVVGGSPSQVYSSKAVAYVPISDPTYVAWKNAGNRATSIATEQELWDVLTSAGIAIPAGGSASDAVKEDQFAQIPVLVRKWAFDVDNRVRVLEGQPTRTVTQFKSYVKGL